MKTFSQFLESTQIASIKPCITYDINPGNQCFNGVSNHWTPIDNIVTNVKNLFAVHMGIVATVAEDGCSLKLHSSKFWSKENTMKVLQEPLYLTGGSNGTSLYSYVVSQGLDQNKLVEYGNYWVVYFYASDLKQAAPVKSIPVCPVCGCDPCTCDNHDDINDTIPHTYESESLYSESEFIRIYEDEEEIEDMNYKEICDLINSGDKVKAAKALANLVVSIVDMPENMYFAAVKDHDGNESIALRQAIMQRRPFGKEEEIKQSLFNIYNTDKEGIWINNWDNRDTCISKDIQDLIIAIMKVMRAKETTDPCIWQLCDGDNLKKDEQPEDIVDSDNAIDEPSEECEEDENNVKESEESKAYVIYDKDGIMAFLSSDKNEAKAKLKEFKKIGEFVLKEEPLSDYEKVD